MQILNSYRIRKKKCHLTDVIIYALNIEGLFFFFWSGYAKLLLLLPVYLVICLGIWNNLPSQIFSLLLLSYMRLLTTNSSICPQTSRCGSQSMLFTATPAWVLPEDRWVVGGGGHTALLELTLLKACSRKYSCFFSQLHGSFRAGQNFP